MRAHVKKHTAYILCLILACAFLAMTLATVGASDHPEDHFSHLTKGGRRSLHGMVVFGKGPYYIEHIPMLSPPHDFQIIAQVELKGVSHDFSQKGFSLKPSSNFSLNDYVSGRLKKFSGSIHAGSFEQDGPVVLENVEIEVLEYKVIRQLPANSDSEWFSVKGFKSNIIRPGKNIQQIINSSTGKTLWCVKGPDFFEGCDGNL